MANSKNIKPVAYKKKKFCFQIEAPKRTYYMTAPNEGERDSWIETLNNIAGGLVENARHTTSMRTIHTSQDMSTSSGAKLASSVGGTTRKMREDDFTKIKVIGVGMCCFCVDGR